MDEPGRTVTDSDIDAFAGPSGDFNPLHMDEIFAAEGVFGTRVRHGALVLAMAAGMREQSGIFRGTIKALWRFANGSSVHPSLRVTRW